MSEQPAEYHAATPPLLRPLNPQEHRETKQLNDALTQAKIQLGDRHAELRMMRVGVEELTKRALKAEATLDETWKLVDAFCHKLDASEQKIAALTTRAEKAEAAAKEAALEVSYFRQMNQQSEKAMIKLAARVKELMDEAAEAEREKMVAYEALRKGRNTTTGTGLPGFTVPQAKARDKARAILTGADPSPANAALIQSAQ